jgi:hypothetical protein
VCVLYNILFLLKVIQSPDSRELFLSFLLLQTSLLLLLLADQLLPASSAVRVPIVFAAAGVPALAETLAVSNLLYVPERLHCCWHPCCFLQISLLLLASLSLLVTLLLICIPAVASILYDAATLCWLSWSCRGQFCQSF